MRAASIAAVFVFTPYILSDLPVKEHNFVTSTPVQSDSVNSSNANSAIPSMSKSIAPNTNSAATILEPGVDLPAVQIAKNRARSSTERNKGLSN